LSLSGIKSEDVLVLLKLAVWKDFNWDLELLAEELGHSPFEIRSSLIGLHRLGLVDKSSDKIRMEEFKKFLIFDLNSLFPVQPGDITKGMSTGAKPGRFFSMGLPYTSIWVWPNPNGMDQGYEIKPLSPHCCFAALTDPRLRHLLAVTETMRIVGAKARLWATEELNNFFDLKEA
jgi:hypothetical protein